MTLNLSLPREELAFKPKIVVMGVGGAGGNAVANMILAQLDGVDFIVANTDAQALQMIPCETRIQLGNAVTAGLGAGSEPDIGRRAAEESTDEIIKALEGTNMLFITAGMGGGTGTGAAPVIAKAARQAGILTVGVVTKPFIFEGKRRTALADAGIEMMEENCDTLLVIPNQNLFRVANDKTTFADAFKMADDVLFSGVRSISELMTKPGLVNLDFADVRTLMTMAGKAMLGSGEATGEQRAMEAADAAIENPLLDDIAINGAQGALINICGGTDMSLFEVDVAASRIRDVLSIDANVIFGASQSPELDGKIRVSLVATGIGVEADALHGDTFEETLKKSSAASSAAESGSSHANSQQNRRVREEFMDDDALGLTRNPFGYTKPKVDRLQAAPSQAASRDAAPYAAISQAPLAAAAAERASVPPADDVLDVQLNDGFRNDELPQSQPTASIEPISRNVYALEQPEQNPLRGVVMDGGDFGAYDDRQAPTSHPLARFGKPPANLAVAKPTTAEQAASHGGDLELSRFEQQSREMPSPQAYAPAASQTHKPAQPNQSLMDVFQPTNQREDDDLSQMDEELIDVPAFLRRQAN